MSLPVDVLAEEVLRLSTGNRARLRDRVVASLDQDRVRDAAWDALAARRDAEVDSGVVALVSGKELVARLRAELE